MKKISTGLLGIFIFSSALNADGFSESDKLIGGKDFPFPTEDEAQMPEDTSIDNSDGWDQGQQSKNKARGKAEKKYVPEVENDGDGQ